MERLPQLRSAICLQAPTYRTESTPWVESWEKGGSESRTKGRTATWKRTVAIKELFPEWAMRHGAAISAPDSRQRDFHMEKERVLEEARIISRLNSPHIVEVQDAFLENNTAYIVMEYLEGQSLQERIDAEGPLPPYDVHRIAIAACNALAEVHMQDLLHRDIKPANIMLASDGSVVLVDFGSARTFDHGQTVSHTRILTTDYAARRCTAPRRVSVRTLTCSAWAEPCSMR